MRALRASSVLLPPLLISLLIGFLVVACGTDPDERLDGAGGAMGGSGGELQGDGGSVAEGGSGGAAEGGSGGTAEGGSGGTAEGGSGGTAEGGSGGTAEGGSGGAAEGGSGGSEEEGCEEDPCPPWIRLPTVSRAVHSQPFQAIFASNVDFPRFRLRSGSLPRGLELRESGELVGTPTELGSFPITVAIFEGQQVVVESEVYPLEVDCYELSVEDPFESLPASVDVYFEAPLIAPGSVGLKKTWSVTEGALPPGMIIYDQGAAGTILSGRPQALGHYSFVLQVVDGPGCSASRRIEMEVCTLVDRPYPWKNSLIFGLNGTTDGYLLGTNVHEPKEIARRFDLPIAEGATITHLVAYFSGSASDSSKPISAHIDGEGLTATSTVPMSELILLDGQPNHFRFDPPFASSSSRFTASIDFSSLSFADGDRLAIRSNGHPETDPSDTWVRTGGDAWLQFGTDEEVYWPKISAQIHPRVCNNGP